MNSREVDRLLDIHIVIDHVSDDAEYGVDDRWPTRTAGRKPETAVFAKNDRGCHRRQRALAWRHGVALTLNKTIKVWSAWLRGKVVHLIVEKHSCTFCGSRRAVRVVERVGVRYCVSLGIDDSEVSRLF